MALAPGTRLGPYEITAQIGVGGMGEVYRATDTNLKRQVAIKVLPDAVATDRERLARFQREAEVLGALNHPNIAAIYGLERSDGQVALVMELVEGPTLADRIAQGPIPVDEALPIARQMAEALEAAHEQGIIHRDLKPANVKVRDDGTVKVLDFGLAKAMEPAAGSSPNLSMSPTITTPAMTEMGMILGTAAYMSPEQAKGRPADKRSDIWAFGAVLYDMLTGRRAFQGEDVSDTMASVLKADVDWGAFPSDIPPSVIAVIKRCLQRDPKQRLRDIGDVRLVLDGVFDTPAPLSASSSQPARRSVPLLLAVGAVGLVVGVLATMLIRTDHALVPAPTPVRRSSVVMTVDGAPVTLLEGQRPSLDAAGRVVVVAGLREDGVTQLFARRLDQTDAAPIPGTDGADAFALSPDGAWLAFVANQQVRKVAMSGGSPANLARMPDVPDGLAWVRGESLIVSGPTGLMRVPAAGGPEEPLTSVDAAAGEVDHRWPSVTSDGRTLAYQTWKGIGEGGEIRLRSLKDGTERTIGRGRAPMLTPSGHLVFGRDGSLWAVPIDQNTLEALGEALPVLDGVTSLQSGLFSFTVGDDGTLVYFRRFERALPMTLTDRAGTTIGSVGQAFDGVRHGPFAFSPNGRFLAITRHPTFGGDEIVVYDLGRAGDRGVVIGGGNSRDPVWTPDGTRLTFYSTRNGSADLFEVPSDFSRPPEPLLARAGDQRPKSWTPDGKVLAFREITSETSDIWILPRDGEPVPLLATPSADETLAAFSPDGKWLAYESDQSGRTEVWVQPYPTAGRRIMISAVADADSGGLTWTRDGLYYTSGRNLYFVPLAPGADVPARVTPRQVSRSGAVAVSPDGQTFVVLEDAGSGDTTSIELVVNWFEELKRLVPTQ